MKTLKPTSNKHDDDLGFLAFIESLMVTISADEFITLRQKIIGAKGIDRSLVTILKSMNEVGIKTFASCSGLAEEHNGENRSGYFTVDKGCGDDLALKIAREESLPYKYTSTLGFVTLNVQVEGIDDVEKKEIWKAISKRLYLL